MPDVLQKQNILAFIDSYKYDSEQLLEDLRLHPSVEKEVKTLLEPASQISDWPAEFRNWRAALFGLIANEVGGIAHPMLRERAAEELFKKADEFGFSASMVKMICGEIYPLRMKLQNAEIDIPQEMESRGAQGEQDGQ
ncbi:MAG: hypothetical protein MN733_37130 [Nitrososphaera sp.]|nr:hypothetical protein [Nitrososphaera sp.]